MTDLEIAMAGMASRNYTYQEIMDELKVTRKQVKAAVALAKQETGARTKAELWYALIYGRKFYRPTD